MQKSPIFVVAFLHKGPQNQSCTVTTKQDWRFFQRMIILWMGSNVEMNDFPSNLNCFPAHKDGGVRIHSKVLVQADSACKYQIPQVMPSMVSAPHRREFRDWSKPQCQLSGDNMLEKGEFEHSYRPFQNTSNGATRVRLKIPSSRSITVQIG